MDRHTFELLEAWVQEAEDAWRSGNRQQAWERYRSILRQRLEQVGYNPAALTAADLTIVERWADLSIPFGRVHDADNLLILAANGYRRIGSHYWFDLITLKRIHLCFGRHAPLDARELFRDLHPPFDDIESKSATHGFMQQMESSYLNDTEDEPRLVLFENFYLQLGRLLLYLGKYQAAIEVLEHGCEIASAPSGATSRNAALHFQLELARARVERGDLAEGGQLLSRIWPAVDQVLQPGHATTWLALSAQLDLLRGELGSAQDRLTVMSKICASNGFELPALRSLLSLAGVFILLNKIPEAEGMLLHVERAEGYKDREIQEQTDRLLKVAKARVEMEAGGAESVAEMQGGVESRSIPKSLPSDFPLAKQGRSLEDFESRALQFQFYLGLRKNVAAQSCLERLRSFRQSDSLLIKLRLRALEATFDYYAQRSPQTAAEALREIMPAFRKLGMIPELWQVYVLYELCLRKLNRPADEINSIQEEKNALLEKLENSLSLADRIVFLLNKPTAEEEEIAQQIRALQDLESASSTGWIKGIGKKYQRQQMLNELLNLIYRQRHAFAVSRLTKSSRQQPWPRISLWKRLFLRSPRHALISFVVLPDAVLGITMTWGKLQYKVSRTTRLWLRQRVKEWHETIPESRPDEAGRLASTIAKQIGITELLTQLPAGVNRLTILPDDVLHGFPFATIRSGEKYLLERFPLSIGFDAADATSRRWWRRSRVRTALLAGITDSVPPLPKTARQLDFVAGWLTERHVKATTIQNQKATPGNLCRGLQTSNLFHLSCHGQFSPDNPDSTGWQLLNGEDHTEIFGLTRIFELDLHQLEHATLLSCWGADNYVRPGRWILSLPEALWRAGTGSVVACLWEISEDCALEFVQHFYDALPGLRTDEAVREAQLRMMENDSGRAREPVEWAGFQLYGTPRKLRM
jgi:CHAT domain-containing protein